MSNEEVKTQLLIATLFIEYPPTLAALRQITVIRSTDVDRNYIRARTNETINRFSELS